MDTKFAQPNLNKMTHTFETEQDAATWMYDHEVAEEDCIDNYRFAFKDDADGMSNYTQTQNDGCCGFFDADIIVAGREATIGCNFGH